MSHGYQPELMRTWTDSGFCITLNDMNCVDADKYMVSFGFHDSVSGVASCGVFPVGMGTAIDADEVIEHCVSMALYGYSEEHEERKEALERILNDMRNEEFRGAYWLEYHLKSDAATAESDAP